MRALILNALGKESSNSPAEKLLKVELRDKGWQYEFFPLREMEIKPCLSCGACATKTPGICSSLYIQDSPHFFTLYNPTIEKHLLKRIIGLLKP